MKTKLTLTIAGEERELAPECLKNWDDIVCTYKRADYGGVVRSFSSKFEFTNDAYDWLFDAYLQDGVKVDAHVALYIIQRNWTYAKEFEAPLDFSTAQWDGHTFTISSIDNGLAALIKARKSTKYEFEVGKEVSTDEVLNYERLVLQNSCSHEIQGDSTNYGAVLIGNSTATTRLPTYAVTSESYENSPIVYDNQTTDDGSAFITVERDCSFKLKIEIWADSPGYERAYINEISIFLRKFRDSDVNMTTVEQVFAYSAYLNQIGDRTWTPTQITKACLGTYRSFDELKKAHPYPSQGDWAKISSGDDLGDVEAVYYTPISNKPKYVQWEPGSLHKESPGRGLPVNFVNCESKKYIIELDIDALTGEKFALFYHADSHNISSHNTDEPFFPLYSKITASWESQGKAVQINAIRPEAMATALLDKIADGAVNVTTEISTHDSRLADTRLLAGESVRNLPDAKIYTSFNEFANWMETVYGYTYTLGERKKSKYIGAEPFDLISDGGDWNFTEAVCPSDSIANIAYVDWLQCFAAFNDDDEQLYRRWEANGIFPDSTAYNGEDGKARKDKVFYYSGRYNAYANRTFYISDSGQILEYGYDAKKCTLDTQTVRFAHRSELFHNREQGITFTDAVDLQIKVDSSLLYSVVDVGYEKQDYEAECGRDEWNFSNHYNTGLDIVEKTLTLQSKYRADCYGLEFLAQERISDTTDNESDNNIFFVSCAKEHEETMDTLDDGESELTIVKDVLVIKRGAYIQGALTSTVFNGEFSPYYCIKANQGFIAAMAPNITLLFASCDGNSDIVIDGVSNTSDIPLTSRLFGATELEFRSMEQDKTIDFSSLIKVQKDGIEYAGFLKQTEYCYARPTDVKYTLILKSITKL